MIVTGSGSRRNCVRRQNIIPRQTSIVVINTLDYAGELCYDVRTERVTLCGPSERKRGLLLRAGRSRYLNSLRYYCYFVNVGHGLLDFNFHLNIISFVLVSYYYDRAGMRSPWKYGYNTVKRSADPPPPHGKSKTRFFRRVQYFCTRGAERSKSTPNDTKVYWKFHSARIFVFYDPSTASKFKELKTKIMWKLGVGRSFWSR